MARFRWLVAASDWYTSSSTVSFRPAKPSYVSGMFCQTPSRCPARAVVVIAPALRGVHLMPLVLSIATIELNFRPVASTPVLFSITFPPES